MLRLTMIATVCALGLVETLVPSHASAQGLYAGLGKEHVGALPARVHGHAPVSGVPVKLDALRHETYPGLRDKVVVGESVVRLVGTGFGGEPEGRTVVMTLSTRKEPVALEVLAWHDDEIRVRLPRLGDLGISRKMVSEMAKQLTAKQPIAGPSVEIGIQREGSWVAKPKQAQLAVAYRDLDGDGRHARDCDDFDARRAPGLPEVPDPEGLDEDCNPDTKGEDPLANLDDPTL